MIIRKEKKFYNVYLNRDLKASFVTLEQARSFLFLNGNESAGGELDKGIVTLFGEYDKKEQINGLTRRN